MFMEYDMIVEELVVIAVGMDTITVVTSVVN
jgi:hypothetical protein